MEGYETSNNMEAPAKAEGSVEGVRKSPWRMEMLCGKGLGEGLGVEIVMEEGETERVWRRWWRTREPRPPVAPVRQMRGGAELIVKRGFVNTI